MFLGSEGTRFIGQGTVDIQLNNWLEDDAAMAAPVRQHMITVAQGLSVLVPERSIVPMNHEQHHRGPPQGAWIFHQGILPDLRVVERGPSPPNNLNLPEVSTCSWLNEKCLIRLIVGREILW